MECEMRGGLELKVHSSSGVEHSDALRLARCVVHPTPEKVSLYVWALSSSTRIVCECVHVCVCVCVCEHVSHSVMTELDESVSESDCFGMIGTETPDERCTKGGKAEYFTSRPEEPKTNSLTSTRRPMLAMWGEDSLTVSSFSI